jgi:hypothetical protein
MEVVPLHLSFYCNPAPHSSKPSLRFLTFPRFPYLPSLFTSVFVQRPRQASLVYSSSSINEPGLPMNASKRDRENVKCIENDNLPNEIQGQGLPYVLTYLNAKSRILTYYRRSSAKNCQCLKQTSFL